MSPTAATENTEEPEERAEDDVDDDDDGVDGGGIGYANAAFWSSAFDVWFEGVLYGCACVMSSV